MPFVGPRGEYLEIVDYDAASGAFYDPVDLNDPETRPNDGLVPAVENPKFHQQMVYAVAMNTIATFEVALGRVALWAPQKWTLPDKKADPDLGFVKRLRIYPHAIREANAYYDPSRKALLFGYFDAGPENRNMLPGTTVFTCLSHDIIVHETCHALLDGMHPYFAEPSNPDVLALHEAFSDIVAILQHFSHPAVLENQIAKTRGDLEEQSLLGQLAQEFGVALGRGGALRDALGEMIDGKWRPRPPDNRALDATAGPHERGSILVAAVFRAFLSIYKGRVADLLRIASQGSGILPEGEIDPDLKRRLAREAAKSARHVLVMCIRALDYCPPVDVTFGDFLRAIVTADRDLYPADNHDYRAAIIEAFTAWGIRPEGMSIVTERTLVWPTPSEISQDNGTKLEQFVADVETLLNEPGSQKDIMSKLSRSPGADGGDMAKGLDAIAEQIAKALNEEFTTRQSKDLSKAKFGWSKEVVLSRNLLQLGLAADRRVEHLVRRFYGLLFWGMIQDQSAELWELIGIDLDDDAPRSINRSKMNGRPTVEVHSVRMANRNGDRGQVEHEYVVELVQSRAGFFDPADQKAVDEGASSKPRDFTARSGVTLLIDARTYQIRRIIGTDGIVSDDDVMARHRTYRNRQRTRPRSAFDGLVTDPRHSETIAALHRQTNEGGTEWLV